MAPQNQPRVSSIVDTFDVARAFNTILEAWGEPRTYGVTLSLNW
jgi:hypothetical protein